MNRIEYEEAYLTEGLEQFKPFLLSPEIFWNINLKRPSKFPPYPQLSLGNMLLSFHILKSGKISADRKELIELFKKFQLEWVGVWQEKAEKEFNYRIKQWHRYLADLHGAITQSKIRFKNEIRIRVLLELLQKQLKDEGDHVIDALDASDLEFHQLMKADDFVWPLEIKSAFASEDFWFLYCSAKQ